MDIDEERGAPPGSFREYISSAKKSIGILSWIWTHLYTAEQNMLMRKTLIYMSGNVLVQACIPLTISFILNGLEENDLRKISIALGATLMLMVVQKFMHLKQARYRETLIGGIQGTLDDFITQMMFEKSLGQHAQHSSTLNAGNIDKGRWKLLDLQGILLFEGFQVLMTLAISFVLLWFVSVSAGLMLSVGFAIYLGWSLFLNHKVVTECTSIDKGFRKINRIRVERWEKVERVKISGKSAEEMREMNAEFNEVLTKDRKFWLWYIGQNTFRDVATLLAQISIIGYGAFQVYHGQMSIGILYPIYSWTGTVIANIWQIGRIEHLLNWNMPSIKATIDAISVPAEVTNSSEAVDLPSCPISIEFRDVSYVYPEVGMDSEDSEDVPHALSRVSFSVDAGEKVGILGRSGAGKSTIMRLLLRSMDPVSGSVLANGIDMKDLNYESWMQALGYIPQHPQVWDGTIRYNLMYGLPKAEAESIPDTEIWEMMRDLQIDFGKRLTKGLYTEVGRGGIKLSGGQAQRLIIGAAAMKRPRIMLIDEATSSLDSTTERKVQEGLTKLLSENVTAIVIAHRLSTVRELCSKFVVLKTIDELKAGESQVEAIGSSFEELWEISPTFRMLAQDQGLQIV